MTGGNGKWINDKSALSHKGKLFDLLRYLLIMTQSHEGPRHDMISCFMFFLLDINLILQTIFSNIKKSTEAAVLNLC